MATTNTSINTGVSTGVQVPATPATSTQTTTDVSSGVQVAAAPDRPTTTTPVHTPGAADKVTLGAPMRTPSVPDQASLHKAEEIMNHLKTLLAKPQGEVPTVEEISLAMKKAEELTAEAANRPNPSMDPEARKVLNDVCGLFASMRSLGENKDLTERIKRLQEESQKAYGVIQTPEITEATKETTDQIKSWVTNWRSLFYLMNSSRDFRQFLLDTIKIVKHIVYSYTDEHDTQKTNDQSKTNDQQKKELSPHGHGPKHVPELTEEEWFRFQGDVQRVLVLVAKESAYRDGINRMLSLLDLFMETSLKQPIQTAVAFSGMAAETEALVACFSGRDALDHFKRHLLNLIFQIQQKEPLQKYLQELKEFILEPRTEQEVHTDAFKARTQKMAYRGRELMRELSKEDDLRLTLEAADDMIANIKNDEFLKILREQAGIVQSDLTYTDDEGKTKVDTDMLLKLQSSLLPVIVGALKFIPVPKISVDDEEKEFWLDNIVLCSYDVVPEHIRFHIQSDSDISVREVEVVSHTYLVIELDNLLTELKDLQFYFKKKSFPQFEEHGKVTFRIKGDGAKLAFTFTLDQGPQDVIPKITEGHADFAIADMDFDFDKSTLNHSLIVPFVTRFFKMAIRYQIEKQVENNLSEFTQKLGDLLTGKLAEINRPFLKQLESAKKVVKSSEITQDVERRKEKLE